MERVMSAAVRRERILKDFKNIKSRDLFAAWMAAEFWQGLRVKGRKRRL
jgi:hypothetical protein